MATFQEPAQDEDSAELTFPKEFENAETLLISEVSERPFYFAEIFQIQNSDPDPQTIK
jgi:hypothetical protein